MDHQKVALVTGGSDGIGRATAEEFAKLGFKVAITGRSQEKLNQVLEKLTELSPSKRKSDFFAIQSNFEDPAQVEPVVSKSLAALGNRLDCLINNAGFPGGRCTLLHPDFYQDFQKVMQVNLMAATRISQLAAPHLMKTKGVIINVSSIADRLAVPLPAYSISKAGMSMLTLTLANSFGGTGCRAVTVSPGPILTNFSPPDHTKAFSPSTLVSRVGEAKEVAETILFLCSEKASFINGCTIDIDGGMTANLGNLMFASASATHST